MLAVEPESAVASLVAKARAGDRAAIGELYRRFAPSVHAVLLSRLPPSEAQDAVHDVFVLVQERLASLAEDGAFGGWIHVIARNLAIDRLRERGRHPREEPMRDVAVRASADGELGRRVLAHLQDCRRRTGRP
jgi:RNA polymerase sigma-70 factor (ECF subfamily)